MIWSSNVEGETMTLHFEPLDEPDPYRERPPKERNSDDLVDEALMTEEQAELLVKADEKGWKR